MTIPRISRKPGLRYINWSPYIRLLADKPAGMYNFSFLDFGGLSTILATSTSGIPGFVISTLLLNISITIPVPVTEKSW